tara:strand:- start:810 stop:1370 length:561 start_codon:yes stop_codon:yes gene_type:complete
MHCHFCKKYIRAGARKCHHCGSRQSFLKWLDAPAFLLAFIVAWVTFLAAAAPLILDIWKRSYADVAATIVASDKEGMQILLSNRGSIGAGVTRAYVSIPKEDGKAITWPIDSKEWGLLEAGKSKLVTASPKFGQLPVRDDSYREQEIITGNCNLVVEFTSADGHQNRAVSNYECYMITLAPWVEIH